MGAARTELKTKNKEIDEISDINPNTAYSMTLDLLQQYRNALASINLQGVDSVLVSHLRDLVSVTGAYIESGRNELAALTTKEKIETESVANLQMEKERHEAAMARLRKEESELECDKPGMDFGCRTVPLAISAEEQQHWIKDKEIELDFQKEHRLAEQAERQAAAARQEAGKEFTAVHNREAPLSQDLSAKYGSAFPIVQL